MVSVKSLWKNIFISTENQLSDYGRISCGIAQGSILEILLSLIQVNDMPQAVNQNLFLYADDSCLIFQHKDVEEIEKVLNNDFENSCDWFGEDKANRFSFQVNREPKVFKKLKIKSATYPVGFWYRYTSIRTLTLAPQKMLLKYCL